MLYCVTRVAKLGYDDIFPKLPKTTNTYLGRFD